MAVAKTAEFTVRPEGLETALGAIREFVAAVRETEPGTRLYVSLQAAEEPTRLLHWMVFDDEEAERRHRSSEAVKRFTETLYPLTVEPPRFADFVRVAST